MTLEDLVSLGLRQYGYLAGVSERTFIEEKWVQRLYGLLVGLGVDVHAPVGVEYQGLLQNLTSSFSRDSDLDSRLERYFLDVELELERIRSQQVYT